MVRFGHTDSQIIHEHSLLNQFGERQMEEIKLDGEENDDNIATASRRVLLNKQD